MPRSARRLRTPGARRPALFWAAVLLALAVGMALGGGVLARFTANSDIRDLNTQVAELERSNSDLTDRVTVGESFADAVAPFALADGLTGFPVLLVVAPAADPADVDQIRSRVGEAGGTIAGTVTLTESIYDSGQSELLRGTVDNAAPDSVTLDESQVDPRARAGDLLGAVLLGQGEPPAPSTGQVDTLAALRQAGFINFDGDAVAGARTAIVISGGAVPDDQAAQGQGIGRFAAGLSQHGDGVVLAGRSGSASGSGPVVVVRQDPALVASLATVDHVDSAVGQVSSILALIEATRGDIEQYGSGAG